MFRKWDRNERGEEKPAKNGLKTNWGQQKTRKWKKTVVNKIFHLPKCPLIKLSGREKERRVIAKRVKKHGPEKGTWGPP